MIYTRYAARTGRIMDVISIPDNDEAYDLHNTLLYPGEADGNALYIVEGILTERPTQDVMVDKTNVIADGEDMAIINGLPEGAVLTVQGPASVDPVTVTDGVLEFSCDVPGDYTVRSELFPFRPFEVVIHAD